MVTNNEDKQGFSDRLNAVLDAAGVVKIGEGRQGILKNIFKVSDKGARKWIQGESIPRYEKILKIVERQSLYPYDIHSYQFYRYALQRLLSTAPLPAIKQNLAIS